MSTETVCSNCGARDSLYQEVRVESDGTRPVEATIEPAGVRAEYGEVEYVRELFNDVISEEGFGCSKCQKTWPTLEEAVGAAKRELLCTDCDWWGFCDWQHGLERPDCPGTIVIAPMPGSRQRELVPA